MENQPIVDETVSMILSGKIDECCIELMNLISASTESAETFARTLVSQRIRSGDDPDAILEETQEFFERIADQSELTACIFMVHLWPLASARIGMHDVCDAIMLWLAEHHQPEVTTHLNYIASSADHESVRERFRQLAAGRS